MNQEASQSRFKILPHSVRSLSRGTSLQGAARTLRQQAWIGPVVTAVVLAVVGWLLYRTVENSLEAKLAEELNTILKADLTALDFWLREQSDNVAELAENGELVEDIAGLLALGERQATTVELLQAPELARVRTLLGTPRITARHNGFTIVNPAGRVLASKHDETVGKTMSDIYPEVGWLRKALAGEPTVSQPIPSAAFLPDRRGRLRSGVPTMFACGPVRNEAGKVIAALCMRIIPEVEFTKILNTAQFGASGESYAFNRDGLLLSSSRFDGRLKQLGLLPDDEDAQSILTLRLRDPLVDLASGARTPVGVERPLTHIASEATAGRDGVDVDGSRDYRGVPVIGAWRWLPAYNFGVATQVDYAEAFEPLRYVQVAFGVVFALLVLTGFGMLIAVLWASRLRLALRVAEVETKQLGQYTLERKLGEGAMGAVYQARHALLRRPTAVKLMHPQVNSDEALARFEREVQLTSQLTHPNTIAIYDYGRTAQGVFYYVMEYLDGIPLDVLVRKFGPQPEGRVVEILRQLCGSLAEAHACGLIHRDIKPANLLLNRRGRQFDVLKVLDFGLVKTIASLGDAAVTKAYSFVGTPHFMSPEAVNTPDAVDARSDLYAIGAVGYFLLCGQNIFDGKNVMEVCHQHLTQAPPPLSSRTPGPISPDLEALIHRCLAKNKEARPQSAEELAELLSQCRLTKPWTRADAEAWWAGLPTDMDATLDAPVPDAKRSIDTRPPAETMVFDGR
ncbi:MAG: serine/threonine protein kinase [Planctomycetes bacterium]|nr:serine/threonine protein kinase [Planctomycetota bacterium]